MTELIIGIAILAFVTFGIFVANTAQKDFQSNYFKYHKYEINGYKTPSEFIALIKNQKEFYRVDVKTTEKPLNDNYNAGSNTVTLSEETISSTNIAGFAITAHEFGHAQQRNTESKLYKNTILYRKLSKISGRLSIPLCVIGFILFLTSNPVLGIVLSSIGVLGILTIIISSLLTTLVEFDASKRGVALLQRYQILDNKEIKQVKKFLKSAGYTYLGNFFSIILSWTFLVPKYSLI